MRLVAAMGLGEAAGITVIEASGGVDGLRKAREEHPDVILLDMFMPEMDGEAVFRALRDDPTTSHIPVIFLTSALMAGAGDQLRAAGARGVIHKPFNPLTLADDVVRILHA